MYNPTHDRAYGSRRNEFSGFSFYLSAGFADGFLARLAAVRSGPGDISPQRREALGVRAQGFTDADLIQLVRELAPVAALRYLYLAENRNVTNRGAAAIAALPQLRYLNLSACDLNSEGLGFLPALVNLETLDLSFCNRVSGAGGKYVQQLPKLKTLLVQGTTKLNTADLKRYEKRGLEIRTGKNS